MTESVKIIELDINDSENLNLIKKDLECALLKIHSEQVSNVTEEIAKGLYESLDSFSIMTNEQIKLAIENDRLSKIREKYTEIYLLDDEIPLLKVVYEIPKISDENIKTKVTITKFING